MKRLVVIGLSLFSTPATAAEPAWMPRSWTLDTAVATSQGVYGDSQLRRRSSHYGLHLSWRYLEQGGLDVLYGRSRIDFKRRIASSIQDEWTLSGRIQRFSDTFGGRFPLRLDGHRIDSNDSDDVTAVGGLTAFTNYARTRYADLGYVASRYGSANTDQWVDQFTVTAGAGRAAYWFQARGYLIRPAESLRPQSGHDWLQAVELKGFRYSQTSGAGKPSLVWIGIVAGERQYTVDPDAYAVYNLADLQTALLEGGLQWTPSETLRLDLIGGGGQYHNHALDDQYQHYYLYVALNHRW